MFYYFITYILKGKIMATRVSKTMTDLDNLRERINVVLGKNYTLDGAYGGYRLWDDELGKDPIQSGFVTKTVLYGQMYAFVNGAIEMKEILKEQGKC